MIQTRPLLNEFQLKDLLKKIGKDNADDLIFDSDFSLEFYDPNEPITYFAIEKQDYGKVWIFELTPKRVKNLLEVPE